MDGPVGSVGSAGTLGGAGGGGAVVAIAAGVNGAAVAPLRKPTSCACGKEGKHYSETAMDTVIPGTPDRIHNLMFASGFMKDFMAGNQKLLGKEYLLPFRAVSVFFFNCFLFSQTSKCPIGLL